MKKTGRKVRKAVKKVSKAAQVEARRKAIIGRLYEQARDAGTDVMMLGSEETRHLFADAILGTTDYPRLAVVYSRRGILAALVEQGCDPDDAVGHYEYNIARSIPCLNTRGGSSAPPILVDDL